MFFLCFVFVCGLCSASVVNFEEQGAIPDDSSLDTCWTNGGIFNQTMMTLQPGDVFLFPNKTFYLMGGIIGSGLTNVTFQFDGTLIFSDNEKEWPRKANGDVLECIYLSKLHNVRFTSTSLGVIDGNGRRWWGLIKYLLIAENRPRLMHIYNSTNLLVEKLFFKDSPYWTFYAQDIANLEIHSCRVDARIDNAGWHDPLDLTAFNTDGFDVSGKNVWIHDCEIWNDDDCIAVKPQSGSSIHSSCSENMLFERINASGVGLTIGSISPSVNHECIRNITFRDCVMPHSFKGIYVKANPGSPGESAEITNILYENIRIDEPTQWAIWIGPQQASYDGMCSLYWPYDPRSSCPISPLTTFSDITLRNVTINSPTFSPGVLLGNITNPMQNVVFDGVVVHHPGLIPFFTKYYYCEGINGIATGGTKPIPPCFNSA
jgi:polygalacturonase